MKNSLKIFQDKNSKFVVEIEFSDGCSYMEIVQRSVSDEDLIKSLVKRDMLDKFKDQKWEITFTDTLPRQFSGKDLKTASELMLSYILFRNSDADDYCC